MSATRRIILPAIIACLLWSSAFVFVKIGLRHAPPLTLAGLRFLVAGVLLLPLSGNPRRYLRAVREHWRVILVVSFFSTILLYILAIYGMTLCRGAQGAIVVGSSPLLAALLAHLLMHDDRLTLNKLIAIGLGIAGVICVALAANPWEAAGLREVAGMGLMLIGESSFIIGNITVLRKMHATLSPITLCSAQMILGSTIILSLALLIEGVPRLAPHPELLTSLGALGIISAGAFATWFHLLRTVKVSALNVWKFLIPVFGAILSWTFLPDESPDLLSVTGMVMIGGAIVWFHRNAITNGTKKPLSESASSR